MERAGFEVVAQAGDADDLLRKVRAHKPDVAVVDVRMPPGNADDGLHAALASLAGPRSSYMTRSELHGDGGWTTH